MYSNNPPSRVPQAPLEFLWVSCVAADTLCGAANTATFRAVISILANFEIFESVFSFSRGKKHFFQKVLKNGLASKKIEYIFLSLSGGWVGQTLKWKKSLFLKPSQIVNEILHYEQSKFLWYILEILAQTIYFIINTWLIN